MKNMNWKESNTEMVCLLVIPETPARDANRHDDIDDHLGKENEEEDEEVEGAVTPGEDKENIIAEQNEATTHIRLQYALLIWRLHRVHTNNTGAFTYQIQKY